MTLQLLDYIPTGAENAIQAGELCKRAGFPSVRVMHCINSLFLISEIAPVTLFALIVV